METSTTSGYAPVNGLNMYYQMQGSGTSPLVLIHGGGSTIETSFGTLIPLLADSYKLIAVELQAHGRTSDRDAPESFEQDADDVAALLKYLNISKASFLGFSNGGTTTLQIGIRHPDMVHKLIVVAGAVKRDGFIPGFFDGMQHATLDNMPLPLKTAFLAITPDKDRLQVMFEKDVARMVAFKDVDDESMKSITAPALFIVGDQDVITVEHTLEMARLVQAGRLVVLPGAHGICIGEMGVTKKGGKQPGITTALIEEFLNH